MAALTAVPVVGASPAAAAGCEKSWASPGTDGVWDQEGVADGGETQWSPAGVPVAGDIVCLPGGDYTVTLEAADDDTYEVETLVVEDGPTAPTFVMAGDVDLTATDTVSIFGDVDIDSAARLISPTVTQEDGTVVLDGRILGDYTNIDGVLHGNQGVIMGDLVNTQAGVIDPGAPPLGSSVGYLSVTGDFTQDVLAILVIDYETSAPFPVGGEGYGYDHLHVGGATSLGGGILPDLTVKPTNFENDVLFGTDGITGTFDFALGVPEEWVSVVPLGSAEVVSLFPDALFDDVPAAHPFLLDIAFLVSEDITGGFPDGTFRPVAPVTRQSMAAFLYRMRNEPSFTPPSPPTFSDVGTTHGFRTEIEWLAAEEITGGFPDGTFRPGEVVTRGSMAAFLYRMAGEPAYTPPSPPTFDDVGASHQFRTEIEWLASTGITTGFSDDTFRPGATVSRQSMSAFLRRFQDTGLVWLA